MSPERPRANPRSFDVGSRGGTSACKETEPKASFSHHGDWHTAYRRELEGGRGRDVWSDPPTRLSRNSGGRRDRGETSGANSFGLSKTQQQSSSVGGKKQTGER